MMYTFPANEEKFSNSYAYFLIEVRRLVYIKIMIYNFPTTLSPFPIIYTQVFKKNLEFYSNRMKI